jgi:hypothetical protein
VLLLLLLLLLLAQRKHKENQFNIFGRKVQGA